MIYFHADKSLSQVIGKIETIQSSDYAFLVNIANILQMSSKCQEILIDRVGNPKQKCIVLFDSNNQIVVLLFSTWII